MIVNVYSLLDTKVGVHGLPFFFVHDQLAFRAVADLAADLSTTVGRHPADFMLVQLGRFDDGTGSFENDYRPLGLAVGLLKRQPQEAALFPAMEG